ncbi:MAG TPA: hypothetical protein VFC04_08495 [Actinomycetota bacterium]|nr:hypothetical protein [Actinomycetota bacterium]
MAEPSGPDPLEPSLRALAAALEFPPAPKVASAVTARLRADRRARPGGRPPFPGLVAWPRRRLLVLAALGALLVGSAAAAARLAVGAIVIRVVPELPTPRPTISEAGPVLGPLVSLGEAGREAGFPLHLPAGLGHPAEVHLARSAFGYRLVILVWRPDARHPPIPGTPWGTILIELPGTDSPLAIKEVAASATIRTVRVAGARGYWLSGPHELILRMPGGERRLGVTGNVLLWKVGPTTLRLETALERRDAIALARTVG